MNHSDPYLQIMEYTVSLAGLERDVTLLQVSDLHIAVAEEESSESYKKHVADQVRAWEPVRKDFARLYGDSFSEEHLLPPEEGLAHFVRLANELQPDALLLTGDMMNEYSEENLRCLQAALQELTVPWVFTPGNHETGHQDALQPLLRGKADVQTLTVGNCKLIALDDSAKRITDAQTERLKAEAEGFVPVLAMHIPVLTEHNRKETSVFDPYFLLGSGEVDAQTKAFLDLLQSDTCPIKLILCGHVHGKHVSHFRKDGLQLCASSAMVGACSLIRLQKA